MGQFGQSIQSDLICIICVQIFFDLGAFFGHMGGGNSHRDQMLGPDDPEDQNLQKILADLV